MLKSFFSSSLVRFFLVITLLYASIPLSGFPIAPLNSPQSQEPGDLLDLSHRRAYFTNFSRQEIMEHYKTQFHPFLTFLPQINLNYPPEESEVYVYSPLLSSFLEELVFPVRESLYISGYQPKENQDKIAYQGVPYQTKITIRYYPTTIWARVLVMWVTIYAIYLLTQLIAHSLPRSNSHS